MIARLAARTLFRSPRRLIIGLVGVTVPVALFAATGFFVDTSAQRMTAQALAPVQIDMQAVLTSPYTPLGPVASALAATPRVTRVEPFASVDLPVQLPGATAPRLVRVFAVRPDYFAHHPWVRPETGSLAQGALLTDSLVSAATPPGSVVQLQVPGAPTALAVTVGGTIDLRKADTWFTVLSGDNQGNVTFVPDALVIDFTTFRTRVLPVLQAASMASPQGLPSAAGGGGGLAPGTPIVQEQVTIDHRVFASDPTVAAQRAVGLRRTLERTAPGQITVVDNLGDMLTAAKADATNAKILFLFLGIPGVLVAGGLAIATAASLAAAQRRELALLRLRGATSLQVSRLSAAISLTVGVLGSSLGLGLAVLAVTLLLGASAWQGVSSGSIAESAVLAFVVGLAVTALSLRASTRAARRGTVAMQRAQLDPADLPAWRRHRLDLVALAVGGAVLLVNAVTGGFKAAPSEGTTLSLSFYLLLAPLALWLGFALLGLRVATAILRWATRPGRARPLGTWLGASLRWLGRRPGRSLSTAIIGTLAVAFGANLLSFVSTYDVAKRTEAAISIGSDLRVTPAQITPPVIPPLHAAGIAVSTPVRVVTVVVGIDKRPAYAVDPATFAAAVPRGPVDAAGHPVDLAPLAGDPAAVLFSAGFGRDFNVSIGDPVTVGLPDGRGGVRNVVLHAAGQFAAASPAIPGADLIFGVGAYSLPTSTAAGVAAPTAPSPASTPVPPPDFYLARLAPGANLDTVAARLRSAAGQGGLFTVLTFHDALAKEQSTLASLNLAGLGRIEAAGTVLIATLGIALLGAFLVLERRREYAVLRSVGATTRQVLVPPAAEGAVTLAVSVLLGMPIGLGMTAIATGVLAPLFTIKPPLVSVPSVPLTLLALAVVAAGGVTLAAALAVVARLRTVAVLRES